MTSSASSLVRSSTAQSYPKRAQFDTTSLSFIIFHDAHGVQEANALLDAALFHELIHPPSDGHEPAAHGHLEGQALSERFHGPSSPSGSSPEWDCAYSRPSCILPRASTIWPARSIVSPRRSVDPNPAVSIFNFHYATPPRAVEENWGLRKAIGDNETGFKGTADRHYCMQGWEFLIGGGALCNILEYSFAVGYEDGVCPLASPQQRFGSMDGTIGSDGRPGIHRSDDFPYPK